METAKKLITAVKSIFPARVRKHCVPESSAQQSHARKAFNPLDPDYIKNPYPFLAELQDSDPVHKSASGAWVLTRYEDVLAAFSDSRLGNDPSPYAVVNERNRERYICADVANNIIPFMDTPRHNRPRQFLSSTFIEFSRDSALDFETIARSIISQQSGCSQINLLDDFATPFSVRVISQILGVPPEDEPKLKAWSEWFFYLFSIIPSEQVLHKMNSELKDFRKYFQDLIELRRSNPKEDLISYWIARNKEQSILNDAALADHCMLFFSDGVENVDSGIANAIHALLKFPQQLKLLSDNPDLIKQAVDECLRYESPGQFVGRVSLEDIELHGVTIRKGSAVLLVVGAANRDPRKFDSPDLLNILRTPNPYISFGKGRHACIGASLVKQEMEAAIKCLLQFLPQASYSESDIHWEARLGHRWIAGLPVTLANSD